MIEGHHRTRVKLITIAESIIRTECTRQASKQENRYNLDAINSVGYCVKSQRGVEGRTISSSGTAPTATCSTARRAPAPSCRPSRRSDARTWATGKSERSRATLRKSRSARSWKSRRGLPPGSPRPRRRYGRQSVDRIARASTDERRLVFEAAAQQLGAGAVQDRQHRAHERLPGRRLCPEAQGHALRVPRHRSVR